MILGFYIYYGVDILYIQRNKRKEKRRKSELTLNRTQYVIYNNIFIILILITNQINIETIIKYINIQKRIVIILIHFAVFKKNGKRIYFFLLSLFCLNKIIIIR